MTIWFIIGAIIAILLIKFVVALLIGILTSIGTLLILAGIFAFVYFYFSGTKPKDSNEG